MKLIQSTAIAPEVTRGRHKPQGSAASGAKEQVEAVERARPSGSYTSNSAAGQQQKLPGHFVEQHHQAIHAYLHTAALDADGGELIGVDTYA